MKQRFARIAVTGSLIATTLFPMTVEAGEYGFIRERARFALNACGGDIARYCGDVFPGGGRIAQCLNDNLDRLSPLCADGIERARIVRTTIFACNADAERYCSDVPPGGGRIVRCLQDHQRSISRECRRSLNEARETLKP